mgnify:CR=1 FL=1
MQKIITNEEYNNEYRTELAADIDKDYYEFQLYKGLEFLMEVVLYEKDDDGDASKLKVVFRDDIINNEIRKEYDYDKIMNMLVRAKERLVLKGKQE